MRCSWYTQVSSHYLLFFKNIIYLIQDQTKHVYQLKFCIPNFLQYYLTLHTIIERKFQTLLSTIPQENKSVKNISTKSIV